MRYAHLIVCLGLLVLTGCQSTAPRDAIKATDVSLEDRQVQTRRFDGMLEPELLAASAGVLQDLGFNLEDSEARLGLIVASKTRDAEATVNKRFLQLLDLLADIEIPYDDEQQIRASIVSWPQEGVEDSYFVRITFQRVVWNNENDISRRETLNDPELYQRFFDRLSKSIFLEAHSL